MPDEEIRVLLVGDIYGKPGRRALEHHLPLALAALRPHLVVVNGENAAHGYGLRPNMVKDMYRWGADVVTTGNHVWDHKEIIEAFYTESRLLRPLNYPSHQPGRGVVDVEVLWQGQNVLMRVLNIAGRIGMASAECPFKAVNEWVGQGNPREQGFAGIIVDFHAEATSEKACMGFYLDGRVTAVLGTHTHIPTADQRVLPQGTGFMSDVGMTGNFTSVIGMEINKSIERFLGTVPRQRAGPEEGEAMLCGIFITTDPKTGLARRLEPLRLGPGLEELRPQSYGERIKDAG